MQDLELWFTKAGLPIKVEKTPLSFTSFSINNQDIFQMTIDTKGKKRKKEYFRVFPGHKNNDVRVIDTYHRDHKTLKLHGWFKVIKNNEPRISPYLDRPYLTELNL